MKTKYCITLLLSVVTTCIFGQTDKINQLDSAGKKHGKWFVYLDKDWGKVKDSTTAVYFRYTYFDHSVNIYPMGPCGGKNYRLDITANTILQDSKIKLLDGEYKWFDSKGRISSIHIFKNGEYVSCKEYYTTGELNQHFDYTKKCKGQQHGWSVSVYDKKGNLTLESYTCKDKDGHWPKMRG